MRAMTLQSPPCPENREISRLPATFNQEFDGMQLLWAVTKLLSYRLSNDDHWR